MKFLWVDSGNDPDWVKVVAHKIDGLFFDLFDPRLTHAYLTHIKGPGMAVGVYVVDNWEQIKNLSGRQAAEAVDARVKQITPSTQAAFPKVQFDLERHDPAWIEECLVRWRELRPGKDTSWTFEGGQGGWMTPAFVAAIIKAKIRLVPQLYNGAMTEVWDSLTYARDLTSRGFPDALVSPFYDAARLPVGWQGWAFTQGRLP